MKKIVIFITILTIALGNIYSQRKVTPVEGKPSKLQTIEGKKAAKKLLDKKIEPSLVFSDSIITLPDENAEDTVVHIHNIYPTMYGVTLGVDLWDPLMRLFGQKYGLTSVSAEMNFHNRYIPGIEVGLGTAKNTPDDGNYTYKTPLSLFMKIGASYNFLFSKNPDYQFLAGFKLGYSSFKYSITDVTVSNGYWQQDNKFDILDQKSNALWGELSLGIRVRIMRNISMGWNFKYNIMFNCKNNVNSTPWYIPGFGSRSRNLTGSFSVYYTIPLNQKPIDAKTAKVINALNDNSQPSDTTNVKANITPQNK